MAPVLVLGLTAVIDLTVIVARLTDDTRRLAEIRAGDDVKLLPSAHRDAVESQLAAVEKILTTAGLVLLDHARQIAVANPMSLPPRQRTTLCLLAEGLTYPDSLWCFPVLQDLGLVERSGDGWAVTDAGLGVARRIVEAGRVRVAARIADGGIRVDPEPLRLLNLNGDGSPDSGTEPQVSTVPESGRGPDSD